MAIINISDLTFNGEEVKAVSEAIQTQAYSNPELNKFHTIVTGINVKKQIAILGRLSGLLGAAQGGCDPTSASNTVTNSEKFWTPEKISDRLEACYDSLEGTFFAYGLKNGIEKADLTGTDFLNFVAQLVSESLPEVIFREGWFSDTSAANYNSSPAGVITNGTNLAYFNKNTGLWKQIYTIVAADATRKTAGLATKNAESTYALQAFNSTDTTNQVVTDTLQNIMYGADERLVSAPDLVLISTRSVANQYARELKKMNSAFTTERLENGISLLKSDGVELYSFGFWDRTILSYFSNGTKSYLPHRIVMASKSNIQIGTEDEASLSKLDIFNDKKSKKNFIDFEFNLDAKIIESHMIQVAY